MKMTTNAYYQQWELDEMDAEDYSFFLAYGVRSDEEMHLEEVLDKFYVSEDTIPEECPY